jgi:hypothetical protein
MANNLLKRLLDAGVTFGEVTQAKADEIFTILRDSGVKRKEAEKTVLELADQARLRTDKFVSRLKSELADQIVAVADRLDSLEDKIEELADRAAGAVNPQEATTSAPSKKTAGKKTASATPGAKKTTAKKSAAKKTTAKKTAKKTTTKKTAKKTTKKKAPAKKGASKESV